MASPCEVGLGSVESAVASARGVSRVGVGVSRGATGTAVVVGEAAAVAAAARGAQKFLICQLSICCEEAPSYEP